MLRRSSPIIEVSIANDLKLSAPALGPLRRSTELRASPTDGSASGARLSPRKTTVLEDSAYKVQRRCEPPWSPTETTSGYADGAIGVSGSPIGNFDPPTPKTPRNRGNFSIAPGISGESLCIRRLGGGGRTKEHGYGSQLVAVRQTEPIGLEAGGGVGGGRSSTSSCSTSRSGGTPRWEGCRRSSSKGSRNSLDCVSTRSTQLHAMHGRPCVFHSTGDRVATQPAKASPRATVGKKTSAVARSARKSSQRETALAKCEGTDPAPSELCHGLHAVESAVRDQGSGEDDSRRGAWSISLSSSYAASPAASPAARDCSMGPPPRARAWSGECALQDSGRPHRAPAEEHAACARQGQHARREVALRMLDLPVRPSHRSADLLDDACVIPAGWESARRQRRVPCFPDRFPVPDGRDSERKRAGIA